MEISPLVSPDRFFGRQAPKYTDSTPGLFGPLRAFTRLWQVFTLIFEKVFPWKCVRRIDQKLSEKQTKHLQQTSLKLLPKNPNLQVNQLDLV